MRDSLRLGLIGASSILSTTFAAAQTSSAPSLRGVAYDSLHSAPLRGATVTISGDGKTSRRERSPVIPTTIYREYTIVAAVLTSVIVPAVTDPW